MQQQKVVTDELFNKVDVDSINYDEVMSQVLNENASLRKAMKEERKEKNMWKEKSMELFDRLGGRELDIILVNQKLAFMAQTGRYTSRELILEDLAKSTAQYGDMMRNECKILTDKNQEQLAQLEEYKRHVADLERRDAANDDGATPTSHKTVTQKQIQKEKQDRAEKAAQDKPPAKLGPPLKHDPSFRRFNPDKTFDVELDTCPECDCEIEQAYEEYKTLHELDDHNELEEIWCHTRVYWCENCGSINCMHDSIIPDTSFGQHFLVKLTRASLNVHTMNQLSDDVEIHYHKRFAHDTLRKGLKAAAAKLTSEYERIGKEIGNSTAGNIDDTPVKIGKKSGRLGITIGDKIWIQYQALSSRSMDDVKQANPYPHLKVTRDAAPSYNCFDTYQLCWAHVKTKIKNNTVKLKDSTATYLYGIVMAIYHYTKTLPPDTPTTKINRLIKLVKTIGEQLLDCGAKSGRYLFNCSDHLFTAVQYPEMSLTNNIAERGIRPFVLKRNSSFWFWGMEGAKRYCIIASVLMTWKAQDKDPNIELLRLFSA